MTVEETARHVANVFAPQCQTRADTTMTNASGRPRPEDERRGDHRLPRRGIPPDPSRRAQLHHRGKSRQWPRACACSNHERHIRPGGTISGPAMMSLADLALYVANPRPARPRGARRHHQPQLQLHAQTRPARPDRRMQIIEAGPDIGGGGCGDPVGRGGRDGVPRNGDLCDSEGVRRGAVRGSAGP